MKTRIAVIITAASIVAACKGGSNNERGSLDTFRRYADQFNKAAEATQKAGMQFCYHHHAFEFGPKEGSRAIDIFLERLDPKLVKFEMDAFWVSVAGQDPVQLLEKWKGRVLMPLERVGKFATRAVNKIGKIVGVAGGNGSQPAEVKVGADDRPPGTEA